MGWVLKLQNGLNGKIEVGENFYKNFFSATFIHRLLHVVTVVSEAQGVSTYSICFVGLS